MGKFVGGEYGKNSKPFDEHIGGKLRKVRTAAKINQTVLGKALGVSFQQIQKFESGQNRISVGQLWLLCRFLEIPITSVFEGASVNMFKRRESTKPVRARRRAAVKAKR